MRVRLRAVVVLLAAALHPWAAGAQDVFDPTAAARHLRAARPQALAPRPASSLDHDAGDVAVLEHDGSNYDLFDASGEINLTPRAALARRFYQTHGDNYDFLVVFTDFEFASPGALAFHTEIRNDTSGIGRPPVDIGDVMGSPSRLKGYIDMAALSRYRQAPLSLDPSQPGFGASLGIVAHEVGHQWLSRVHFRDASGHDSPDLIGQAEVHWSYLLDSDASFMYGADWTPSGDGRFTAARIRDTYSSLDLYLMGLIEAARTPPFTLLRAPAIDRHGIPDEGARVGATAETITIDQVIAAEGPRSPGSRDAQKDFRIGFIFLTAQGGTPAAEDLAAVERVRAAFADYFFAKTRGLALADTTLAEAPEEPPAPAPDVERAVQWLLARQAADGRWEDAPATAVRDTAAAIEALDPLPEATEAVERARAWLRPLLPATLDHAARRAVALATPTLPPPDRASLIGGVLADAAPDGGFGIAAGYAPDALDTALALRALAALKATETPAAAQAVAAVAALRDPSGAFPVVSGGPASTVVTAEAILALGQWPDLPPAQALVPAATAALLGRRNPDGGFGESPSTPYATALALRALLSANAPPAAVNPPTAWLQGHQHGDGSWTGGVYPTALTVAALRESAGANLTVPQDGLRIEPPTPTEGQVVAVSARVRNAGRTAAPSQHVRLFDGDPALGRVVGETTLGPLGPGQEGPVAFDFDTTDRPGPRTLYVVADALGEVRETREDDNTGSRSVTVTGLLPNLQVTPFDVVIAPNPPEDGETATVAVTVRNTGPRPAGPTRLEATLGDPRAGGQPIGRATVPALAPGAQTTVAVPWNTLGQRGPHEVAVRADAEFRVPEADETDNEAVVPVTVSGPLPPGPDLAVAAVRGRPERLLTLPQPQAIDALVQNLGRDAAASTVALRDAGGAVVGQQTVNVAARSAQVVTFELSLDGPGSRTFEAVADPDGTLAETREDNNSGSLTLVDSGDTVDVELPAGGVAATPSELRAGETLTVSALVHNRGTAPLLDVPVLLAHAAPAGPVELARRVVSLPPGASTTLGFEWTASIVGDVVPLAVIADPFAVLDELSETNNRRDLAVRVQPSALPNLRVSGADIHFQPDPPLEGSAAAVSVVVRNTGSVSAGPFAVRFFRGDPDDGGTLIGAATVPGLEGGASATPGVTWPAVDTRGVSGIFALADAEGAVAEYDETDNRAFRPVSVLSLPDLVVTSADVTLAPGFPHAGQAVLVTARVRNLGQQPAPASALRAWEGEVGGGTVIGTLPVPALAALESAEVTLEWTPAAPPGEVTLSVVADADAAVREADEGNNTARRTVVVQDADLYLTEPAFSPNGDGVQDTTTLAWRATSAVNVVVSDGQGRRVRTLAENAPAQGAAVWDGRDGRGHVLWDGGYFITVEGPDRVPLGRATVTLDTNRSPIHDAAATGLVSLRNLTCALPAVLGPAWMPAEDEALFVVPTSTPEAAAGLVRVAADGQWSYVGGAPDPWYEQDPNDPSSARTFVSDAAVSPDGREALLSDGAGGLLAVDLRSGARRPIAGSGTAATWSPDGRWIALGTRIVDRAGGSEVSLPFVAFDWSPGGDFLTDGRRVVRRDGTGERELPLPVSDPVDQVRWLDDGRIFVRTLRAAGFSEEEPMNGFLVDPETDTVTALPWVPRIPPAARLALTPNGARAAYRGEGPANVVREDGSELRLADPGPTGSAFAVSPHSRVASYSADGHGDSGATCAGPPGELFVLSGLQNMTLDLELARLPANNGIVVRGTATDRDLEHHQLDYATADAPEAWHPIGPSSAVPVVDDVLAVWVPPGPGTYVVRLSARDRAGNSASTSRVAAWDRVPAVANVTQSERLISPTGDGVKDTVRFSYLVVEPTRVDVTISGPLAAGQTAPVVRRLEFDHPTTGPAAFDWDGRDATGGVVPDGRYTVAVNGLPFRVDVDGTPPDIAWSYQDLRTEPRTPPAKPGEVAAARHWHIVDPHLAGWTRRSTFFTEEGREPVYEPERDADGQIVYVNGVPKVKYDGARAADTVGVDRSVEDGATDPATVLTATDHAGNRSSIAVAPVPERLFLLGARDDSGLVIGAPVDPGPHAFKGQVVFALGETLRATPPNAPATLHFEYRAAGALDWTPAPTFEGRSWGADFEQLGLAAATVYRGRFSGQGVAPASSEDFAFTLCDVTASLSIGEAAIPGSDLKLYTVRVTVSSPADPVADVVLRARGPNGFTTDAVMERQPDGSFLKTVIGPAGRCGPGRMTFQAGIDGTSGRQYENRPPCRGLLAAFPNTCTGSALWQEFPFCAASPAQAYIGTDLQNVADGVMTVEAQGSTIGSFQVVGGRAPRSVAVDASPLAEGRVAMAARHPDGSGFLIAGPAADTDVWVEPGTLAGQSPLVDRTPPAATVTNPEELGRLCIATEDNREVATVTLAIDEQGRQVELGAAAFQPQGGAWQAMDVVGAAPVRLPTTAPARVRWNVSEVPDGSYTVRVPLCDRAGHRTQVERRLTLSRAPVPIPIALSRTLFSPNGDGRADETVATVTLSSAATLNVEVRGSGGIVRRLVTDQPYEPGPLLLAWDGRDGTGQIVADGRYTIVAASRDECAITGHAEAGVEVDTQPPAAAIAAPTPGQAIAVGIDVRGQADDLHLRSFELAFGEGAAPTQWMPFASGVSGVPGPSGFLGRWNTPAQEGPYALRLQVTDKAENTAVVLVPVTVTPSTILDRLTVAPAFSPNGDGQGDAAAIEYVLRAGATVTVTVRDAQDGVVRTLVPAAAEPAGTHVLAWDGRVDGGAPAPEGDYTVHVHAEAPPTPAEDASGAVVLDRLPPAVSVSSPLPGAVVAAGAAVRGTVADPRLAFYAVTLRAEGAPPAEIARGTSNATDAPLASLPALADGPFVLAVTAEDVAGNRTTAETPLLADTLSPVARLIAPGDVLARGATPIVLNGTATDANLRDYVLEFGAGTDPAAFVEIARGTTSVPGGPLGQWNAAALTDGVYTLRLTVTDRAGQSAEARASVTLDGTAPRAVLTAPDAGAFLRLPSDVRGSAGDAHLQRWSVEMAPGTAEQAHQWSPLAAGTEGVEGAALAAVDPLPPDGVHTVRLTVRDAAGNVSTASRTFTVDTVPPGAAGTLQAEPVRTASGVDVRLTWSAVAGPDVAGYVVARDGGALTPEPIAALTFVDVAPAEGSYRYSVHAVDRAGNAGPPAEASLRLDRTPPLVAIDRPSGGQPVSGAVEVRGTAHSADFKEYRLLVGAGEQPATWSVLQRSNIPVAAARLGNWTAVGAGPYVLALEGEDTSGNVARTSVTVIVDNVAPAAPMLDAVAPQPAPDALAPTWRPSPDGDVEGYLVYRDGRLANATGVVIGDLRPYLVPPPTYVDAALPDGERCYRVVAMDRAGNLSPPSNTLCRTLDNRRPHAVVVAPPDGTRFEFPLRVLADTPDTDVAAVQFELKRHAEGEWQPLGAADAQAPFETTLDPATLVPGAYDLRARARDAGGDDAAPLSIAVTYGDTTAPAAPRDLVARVDGAQVRLAWTANGEPDLAGYVVWRNDERLTPAPVPAPPFLDTVPAPGAYTYRVSAIDGEGNESGLSAPAAALVYQPRLEPAFPVVAASLAALPGDGARANTTIDVRRGDDVVATTAVTAGGPFTVPAVPLAAGANVLTARGRDADGNRSIDSAEAVVISNEAPAAVTGLDAAVTGDAVDLTWTAVAAPDLFGYAVRRDGHDLTSVTTQTAAAAISASSTAGSGFEPARAFDGDPATAWLADPADRAPAWTVTFAQPVLVHAVRLAFPSPAAAYRVEVGWQGRFLPVARVRDNAAASVAHVLPAPFATDAVRVVLDGQPAGLAEVGIDVLALVPGARTTFHDAPVADGQHDYEVRAVDVYGAAGEPAQRRVPVGDVTPPEAPANVAAQVEGSDVALAWAPAPEADVTHYVVLRDGVEVATTSAPQHRDVGLPNGTYQYVVVAVDAAGNRSAGSAPVVATVAVAAPAPPVLAATALANGAVRLAWTHAGAARFEILFASAAGGPFAPLAQTGDTRAFIDGSGASRQARFYVVQAADARGTLSAPSNVAAATPARTAPPAPPVLLRPTDAGHPLSWPSSGTALDGRALSGALVGVSVGGTLRTVTEAGPPFQPWATEALAGPAASPVVSLDARHLAYGLPAVPDALQWRDLESLAGGEVRHPGGTALRARAFSPDGRRLAYTARVCDAVSCRHALFAIDLEGGAITPLDAGAGDVAAADWAADGASVAFAAAEADACGIWVRRFGESGARRLATAARCGAVRLAPAAAQIAATVFPDGGPSDELWSVDVATGEVTVLATNVWAESRPSWTHDGTRVAYTAPAAEGLRARVVDVATRDRFDLADPSRSTLDPQFDPDGGWLSLTALRATATGPERVLLAESIEDGRRVEVAAISGGGPWPLHSWMSQRTLAVALPDRVVFLGAEGAFHVDSVRLAPGTNAITAEATDPEEGLTSAPSRPITLEVATGPFADLVVAPEALATYPDIPGVGQDTLVKARVDNLGPAPAGNVRVLLGIKDADGAVRLSHEAEVSLLPAGTSAWVSAFWTPLQPGTYALRSQADPADAVAEVREDNNEAARGVLVAPQAGVIVNVSADRAEYGPNAPALVTVRATNAGPDFAGTLVTAVEGSGTAAVIDTRPIALAYGQTATFTLPWNTGTTYAGSYEFVARASGTAGGGEGRQAFRIRADVNVEVRLLPAQASVAEGQPAVFTVRVSNRGVNAILDGTAALLTIAPAAGGAPVFSASTPVPSLLPGGTWDGTLAWPAARPAGDYVATAEVRDGAATLASHAAPLQVRGVAPVAGTLAVPAHVVAGDAVAAEATVTNTGTLALAGEPFEVALLDGATGAVLRQAAFTLDLAPGERRQRAVTLPAGVLSAGAYPVVLRSPRFALTLDRATVRVHGPLTAPSIDAPAQGARVPTAHPLLVVLNAGAPAGTTPAYEFQLFADPALTVAVPGAAGVPQAPVRTSWRVAIALAEDRTYYWRARAADSVALSPWTAVGSFTVDAVNRAPDAPVPDSPDAGAHVATLLPQLVVRNAHDLERDTLRYDFRVADDEAMSNVVASVAGLDEGAGFTAWTVPEPLVEDRTYFWTARAVDAAHASAWSVPSAFVVDATNQSPSAPQPLRPVGGATVATLQPELAVGNATDPEGDGLRYRFEVDVVPSFDSPQLQVSPSLPETAGETAWTPPLPLADNTPHFWRAAAHDGHTSGLFAGSTFFVNLANDPPSAPVALSPTAGMVVGTATPTLRLRNAVDVDRDPLTYEFEVTDEGGGAVLAAQVDVPAGAAETEWTVSPPLPENVHALWRARAHDAAAAGPWSEPQPFRVNAVAEPPTPPTLAAPADDATVDVARPTLGVHNASSPDEQPLTYTFELYAVDGEGNETLVERAQDIAEGTGQTSWTPSQDLPDGPYRWRAAAVDPVQSGPWMTTARFTVLVDRPPQPPTALQAVAGDAQVHLTWNAVPEPDVLGYRVLRATVSGGPYTPVATVDAPGFTDTGLANGVTVFYVVTALDARFESARSGEVAATPRPAVLAAELRVTPGALRGECLLGGPCAADCPPWIYATIELPFGMPPDTIDRATIRLGGTLAPDPAYVQVVDRDGDGQPELEQRFALEGVAALVHVGANTVSISGRADGSDFRGGAALDVAPLHVVMGVGPRVLKKSAPNASTRFVARLNLDSCVGAAELVPDSVRLNGVVAPLSVNVEGSALIGMKFLLLPVIKNLPVGDAVEVRITGTIRAVDFAGTAFVRVLP